jgi:isoamylase
LEPAQNPIPLEDYLSNAHIKWHGTVLEQPDWGSGSHSIAVTFHNHALNNVRYIAINSYWNALEFQLPPLPESRSRWIRLIDTSLGAPDDIAEAEKGLELKGTTYKVNPHSMIMLHYASLEGHPQQHPPQVSQATARGNSD